MFYLINNVKKVYIDNIIYYCFGICIKWIKKKKKVNVLEI